MKSDMEKVVGILEMQSKSMDGLILLLDRMQARIKELEARVEKMEGKK